MNILGIAYGHNATVCLIQDGHITFCQSEERLNRIKNSTGFPELTIRHIHDHILPPEQIDLAVLYQNSPFGYLHLKNRGFKPYQYGHHLDPEWQATGLRAMLLKTHMGWALSQRRMKAREQGAALRQEMLDHFSNCLGMPQDRVVTMDHHTSHTYSTLPNVQEWERALIFTLDGQGDAISATVSLMEDGRITELCRDPQQNSLGHYYTTTTELLGMKGGEHEFKVMGLAPYAKSRYYAPLVKKLKGLIRVDENGRWRSRVTPSALPEALEKIYRFQRFDNVAGAIQELTESLVLQWVHHWVEHTGCANVALAGGVFMNVKACQLLAESERIEKLYVTPSAADESCAIGAAVWGNVQHAPNIPVAPLQDLYLGMDFGEDAIEKAIRDAGAKDRYQVSRPDSINSEIGRLLAQDIVVARCSGPMEFGARALGNRSILANPSNFDNLRLINDAIKSRDFWMPFTPSILDVDLPRYIVNWEKLFAPYMCITFRSTEEARKDLAAAIHPRDHTVRPQTVLKAWNPDYYEIISTFKSHTGIGGVLNTSFNLHGEPNVCTPEDAIRTVDLSGLTHLALGPYLLEKT
ncbi:MAG: carbamoyltransferase C-terminal domain-containing protein [Leptospirillia bacterium]